jgi:hypothetical protein
MFAFAIFWPLELFISIEESDPFCGLLAFRVSIEIVGPGRLLCWLCPIV